LTPFEGAPLHLMVSDLAPPRAAEREDLVLSIDAPEAGAEGRARIDRFLDAARKHCEDLVTAPLGWIRSISERLRSSALS